MTRESYTRVIYYDGSTIGHGCKQDALGTRSRLCALAEVHLMIVYMSRILSLSARKRHLRPQKGTKTPGKRATGRGTS